MNHRAFAIFIYNPIFGICYAVWLLAMIAIPILRRLLGDSVLATGVSVTVLLQATATFAALCTAWPGRKVLKTALLIVVLAWMLEWIGSTTGIPFGRYHYTDQLQPQLGRVPLLIPLAWLMMLPPAWAIGQSIIDSRIYLPFVSLSALAFTAWDFFLDPQMVAWGLWEWEAAGGYFGIPWINFAGWALGAAVVTTIVRPVDVPIRPLALIYVTTWFLQLTGQLLFWRMVGPALGGGVSMGVFVMFYFYRSRSPLHKPDSRQKLQGRR